VFFAGKGGVGKTTCAVEFARGIARRSRPGSDRTLIVSTDPAHSLGDLLGVRLAARPKNVGGRVFAAELDAPRAFARWLSGNRRALTDILERGTWLDREDVGALLDLTIPGVDELAGLIEISTLARGPYQHVVVDTAPTGHMLRLLAAPAAVIAVADVLDALQEDHRIIRARLAGASTGDAADRLIELLARQATEVAALLADRTRTSFHWVMLPEQLSIAETDDGLEALARAHVEVAEVIVNRVWPRGARCRVCDRRRASDRASLRRIRTGLGRTHRVRVVPERVRNGTKDTKGTKDAADNTITKDTKGPLAATATDGARLVFVGGKGGVGKTTVAAAIALQLAHAHPGRSVLLLSTDPAHSVGDVFDVPAGDDERHVRGGPANLVVRELDAATALARRRGELESAFDALGEHGEHGRQVEPLGFDAGHARRLLDLAPPGIDELFGMLTIVDARSSHAVVVVDMAPTGHALRLLEMPDAAREWVQTLLRVLLKYRAVVRPGKMAADLVEASQSIRTLQSAMRNRTHTRFVVVTRAEQTVRAETERLLRRLRALKLAVPAIVVNARMMEPHCSLCRATASAEEREMRALSRFARTARLRDCAIIQTPVVAPPPRGVAALNRWARHWQQ
jgi:arsenite-transporting ATPase